MTSVQIPHRPDALRLVARTRRAFDLSRRQELVGLALVWIGVSAWVWGRLDQGWVAHDDGALGESAVRVLHGQLPHRDFAELYTGGMTFLNAGMMYLLGENLIVLRYPLFVVFLALVPAAYFIARRVTGPWTALLAAVLAGTWSLPVNPQPMPSWYVLIFSIYAACCLVRWRETGSDRWLVAAGVLAGISVDFKIVGVYLIVAVLLFLVFVHPVRSSPRRTRRFDAVSIGAVLLVAGLMASVFATRFGGPEIANLVLPVTFVVVAVVLERSRRRDQSPGPRRTLGRDVCVFVGACALPLVALLVPYVVTGAVGDLLEGVFIAPQSRRDLTYWATPSPFSVTLAVVLGGLVFARSRLSRPARLFIDVGLTVLVLAALLLAGHSRDFYAGVWVTGRGLATVVVVAGAVLLAMPARRRVVAHQREVIFLTVTLVAFMGLVQFPFGLPFYYCYVAPLVVLAAVAVVSAEPTKDRWLVCALVGAFALYGALYLDRAAFGTLAYRFIPDNQTEVLDPQRASIRVNPAEAAVTRRVVGLLRSHSRGDYTYAGPNAPQLYFLSGLRNPTRALIDVLDTTNSARGDALIGTLRRRRVTAIAVNIHPPWSDPLDARTLKRLATMYPNVARVGGIDVRWSSE